MLLKSYKKATALLVISTFIICIITILPLGEWLNYPLEKRFPLVSKLPDSVDGIIVLGGAENIFLTFQWKTPQVNGSAERFFTFIQLVKKYPDAKHLYTGGSASMVAQDFKGADVAKSLFINQGLDVGKIVFESQSLNTFENVTYSYKLMQPKPDEKWILITSASHMPRAVGIFKKIGWHIIPYPVDHNSRQDDLMRIDINYSYNLYLLKRASYEWTGLIAYYLTGKTNQLFPGP